MLKRVQKDAVIPTFNLKVVSLGETIEFGITYFARSQAAFQEKIAELQEGKVSTEEVFAWLVRDWECEYPLTKEGLEELESERKGILSIIISAWVQATEAHAVKN
jgi:hypothetical protein